MTDLNTIAPVSPEGFPVGLRGWIAGARHWLSARRARVGGGEARRPAASARGRGPGGNRQRLFWLARKQWRSLRGIASLRGNEDRLLYRSLRRQQIQVAALALSDDGWQLVLSALL